MRSCLVENKELHFFARLQPFFFIRAAKCEFFCRTGFFMQTNAISSNLVRSRKDLCETPKHDRILKRNALRCHRRGHCFSRICWTPVRMHVRMSPFSRYSSSRVIMCTITCIPNALLSCLPQNKQLRSFGRLQPFFSLERRNANFFWRNGVFMQTNAISSNLVRSRKNLCQTPKHDRILMFTNWILF